MRDAEIFQRGERALIDVGELADTIVFDGPVFFSSLVRVAKEAHDELIDDLLHASLTLACLSPSLARAEPHEHERETDERARIAVGAAVRGRAEDAVALGEREPASRAAALAAFAADARHAPPDV